MNIAVLKEKGSLAMMTRKRKPWGDEKNTNQNTEKDTQKVNAISSVDRKNDNSIWQTPQCVQDQDGSRIARLAWCWRGNGRSKDGRSLLQLKTSQLPG